MKRLLPILLLTFTLTNCGDDKPSTVSCGEGTTLVGNKCVSLLNALNPTTPDDFQAAAMKAITGNSGLGEGSSATCDLPDSTDVGTTFDCVGTTADGTDIPLQATIDRAKHVIVGNPPSS